MKKSYQIFMIIFVTLFLFVTNITIIPSSSGPVSNVQAASKIKISNSKVSMYMKQSYILKVTGTKKKAKWSSSNKKIATVNSKGKVTAIKTGKVTITAKVGSKKYKSVITILKNPALSGKAISLYPGKTTTLKVSNAIGSVKWSSSNSKVATVNGSGVVKGIAPGKTVITATVNGVKLTSSVTVLKIPTISEKTISLYTGEKKSLKVSNASGTVKWTSKNPSIATVDANGLVRGVAEGTTSITAVANGFTLTCSVKICQSITGIELDQSFSLISQGESLQLDAEVLPENAYDKTVLWTSSNTSVVTVDDQGIVSSVSDGTATITAMTSDKKYSDTCTITVKTSIASVSLAGDKSINIDCGKTAELSYETLPKDIHASISYQSDNDEIASVDKDGTITAKKSGTTNITITAKDDYNKEVTASKKVTVFTHASSIRLNDGNQSLYVNDSFKISAKVLPEDSNDQKLLYNSSDENVATVSKSGIVSAISEGSARITVSSHDDSSVLSSMEVEVKNPLETHVKTVSTQEDLEEALKDEELQVLNISTNEDSSMEIPKVDCSSITLNVDAPQSHIENYASFRSIVINAISNTTFVEHAEGNIIYYQAENGSIEVGESGDTSINVLPGASNLSIENNGNLNAINVAASKTDIVISGNSTQETIPLVASEESQDTSITTSANLDIVAESTLNITLLNGGENSTVTVDKEESKPVLNGLGEVTVKTLESGSVANVIAENVQTVYEEKYNIAGSITDSDNNKISQKDVYLLPYSSNLTVDTISSVLNGDDVISTKTDENGVFIFQEVMIGNYYIYVSVDSYQELLESIVLLKEEDGKNYQYTLEKIASETSKEQVRFEVTYKKDSVNLQSALIGPLATGYGSFKLMKDGDDYEVNGAIFADMQRNQGLLTETETSSIYVLQEDSYHFYLYDVDGMDQKGRTILKTSGVEIKAYINNELKAVYTCPSQAGNLWYVCDYDAKTNKFIKKNTLSDIGRDELDDFGRDPLDKIRQSLYDEILYGQKILDDNGDNLEGKEEFKKLIENGKTILDTSKDENELNQAQSSLHSYITNHYLIDLDISSITSDDDGGKNYLAYFEELFRDSLDKYDVYYMTLYGYEKELKDNLRIELAATSTYELVESELDDFDIAVKVTNKYKISRMYYFTYKQIKSFSIESITGYSKEDEAQTMNLVDNFFVEKRKVNTGNGQETMDFLVLQGRNVSIPDVMIFHGVHDFMEFSLEETEDVICDGQLTVSYCGLSHVYYIEYQSSNKDMPQDDISLDGIYYYAQEDLGHKYPYLCGENPEIKNYGENGDSRQISCIEVEGIYDSIPEDINYWILTNNPMIESKIVDSDLAGYDKMLVLSLYGLKKKYYIEYHKSDLVVPEDPASVPDELLAQLYSKDDLEETDNRVVSAQIDVANRIINLTGREEKMPDVVGIYFYGDTTMGDIFDSDKEGFEKKVKLYNDYQSDIYYLRYQMDSNEYTKELFDVTGVITTNLNEKIFHWEVDDSVAGRKIKVIGSTPQIPDSIKFAFQSQNAQYTFSPDQTKMTVTISGVSVDYTIDYQKVNTLGKDDKIYYYLGDIVEMAVYGVGEYDLDLQMDGDFYKMFRFTAKNDGVYTFSGVYRSVPVPMEGILLDSAYNVIDHYTCNSIDDVYQMCTRLDAGQTCYVGIRYPSKTSEFAGVVTASVSTYWYELGFDSIKGYNSATANKNVIEKWDVSKGPCESDDDNIRIYTLNLYGSSEKLPERMFLLPTNSDSTTYATLEESDLTGYENMVRVSLGKYVNIYYIRYVPNITISNVEVTKDDYGCSIDNAINSYSVVQKIYGEGDLQETINILKVTGIAENLPKNLSITLNNSKAEVELKDSDLILDEYSTGKMLVVSLGDYSEKYYIQYAYDNSNTSEYDLEIMNVTSATSKIEYIKGYDDEYGGYYLLIRSDSTDLPEDLHVCCRKAFVKQEYYPEKNTLQLSSGKYYSSYRIFYEKKSSLELQEVDVRDDDYGYTCGGPTINWEVVTKEYHDKNEVRFVQHLLIKGKSETLPENLGFFFNEDHGSIDFTESDLKFDDDLFTGKMVTFSKGDDSVSYYIFYEFDESSCSEFDLEIREVRSHECEISYWNTTWSTKFNDEGRVLVIGGSADKMPEDIRITCDNPFVKQEFIPEKNVVILSIGKYSRSYHYIYEKTQAFKNKWGDIKVCALGDIVDIQEDKTYNLVTNTKEYYYKFFRFIPDETARYKLTLEDNSGFDRSDIEYNLFTSAFYKKDSVSYEEKNIFSLEADTTYYIGFQSRGYLSDATFMISTESESTHITNVYAYDPSDSEQKNNLIDYHRSDDNCIIESEDGVKEISTLTIVGSEETLPTNLTIVPKGKKMNWKLLDSDIDAYDKMVTVSNGDLSKTYYIQYYNKSFSDIRAYGSTDKNYTNNLIVSWEKKKVTVNDGENERSINVLELTGKTVLMPTLKISNIIPVNYTFEDSDLPGYQTKMIEDYGGKTGRTYYISYIIDQQWDDSNLDIQNIALDREKGEIYSWFVRYDSIYVVGDISRYQSSDNGYEITCKEKDTVVHFLSDGRVSLSYGNTSKIYNFVCVGVKSAMLEDGSASAYHYFDFNFDGSIETIKINKQLPLLLIPLDRAYNLAKFVATENGSYRVDAFTEFVEDRNAELVIFDSQFNLIASDRITDEMASIQKKFTAGQTYYIGIRGGNLSGHTYTKGYIDIFIDLIEAADDGSLNEDSTEDSANDSSQQNNDKDIPESTQENKGNTDSSENQKENTPTESQEENTAVDRQEENTSEKKNPEENPEEHSTEEEINPDSDTN